MYVLRNCIYLFYLFFRMQDRKPQDQHDRHKAIPGVTVFETVFRQLNVKPRDQFQKEMLIRQWMVWVLLEICCLRQ